MTGLLPGKRRGTGWTFWGSLSAAPFSLAFGKRAVLEHAIRHLGVRRHAAAFESADMSAHSIQLSPAGVASEKTLATSARSGYDCDEGRMAAEAPASDEERFAGSTTFTDPSWLVDS
jgi:hypothetical protein